MQPIGSSGARASRWVVVRLSCTCRCVRPPIVALPPSTHSDQVTSPSPLRLPPAEKLDVLRCLDRYRNWLALDDRRLCLCCGKIITGRQIEIALERGGTGLRASCPTENCASIPMDWALPGGVKRATPPRQASPTQRATSDSANKRGRRGAFAVTDAGAASVIRGAWRALRARP
jgi:hypothetical protein